MRLLQDWQYKYIEKCLFGYKKLLNTKLDTEKGMLAAINYVLEYFKGQPHEIMIKEYYFGRDKYLKRYTPAGHYRYVCYNKVFLTEPQGYVIRREIVYRIAMVCFELHIFKTGAIQ